VHSDSIQQLQAAQVEDTRAAMDASDNYNVGARRLLDIKAVHAV
jgi:hypothetical protein